MRVLPSPLLVVTDRHGHPRPLAETVQRVLDGGARWIWLRDRDLAPEDRRRLGEAVAERVRAAGGVLSVGGDVALARALGVDGVHLGGGSGRAEIVGARRVLGPDALVGVSAHCVRDVEAAREGSADYVTLSPVFPSASKPGYGPPLGHAGLATLARIGLPVVGLGGIDTAGVASCRAAGAAGIAVMGGLMRAADPSSATEALLKAWTAASPPHPPGKHHFAAAGP